MEIWNPEKNQLAQVEEVLSSWGQPQPQLSVMAMWNQVLGTHPTPWLWTTEPSRPGMILQATKPPYLEDHPRTRKWLISMVSKSPK